MVSKFTKVLMLVALALLVCSEVVMAAESKTESKTETKTEVKTETKTLAKEVTEG